MPAPEGYSRSASGLYVPDDAGRTGGGLCLPQTPQLVQGGPDDPTPSYIGPTPPPPPAPPGSPGGFDAASYANLPVAFAQDCLKQRPHAFQREVANALTHYQKVMVPGATSVGKGWMIAWLVLWWLCTRPFSIVVCTSSSSATLSDSIWKDIRAIVRQQPMLDRFVRITKDRVGVRGFEDEWFAVARVASPRYDESTGEAHAENIAGRYAPGGVLMVIDEASGVHDAVFDTLLGSATAPDRKILVCGNPLRCVGKFYRIGSQPAAHKGWYIRHVSYLDSPSAGGVDDDEIGKLTDNELLLRGQKRAVREGWRVEHGSKSAYYMARARGEFPTAATDDTVFSAGEIEAAQANYRFGVIDDPMATIAIGLDVAWFGANETSWVGQRNNRWLGHRNLKETGPSDILENSVEFATMLACHEEFGHARRNEKWFNPRDVVEFRVDATGAASVVEDLRKDGWRVLECNNGAASTDPKLFKQLGDELWFDLKKKIRFIGLPTFEEDGEIVAMQLGARRFTFTGVGVQRRLLTKKEMRAKHQPSPDRADAAVLAFADRAKFRGAELQYGFEDLGDHDRDDFD